jgi:hypothetical protein
MAELFTAYKHAHTCTVHVLIAIGLLYKQASFLKKPSDFGQGLRAICCDSEGKWYGRKVPLGARSALVQFKNRSHKYTQSMFLPPQNADVGRTWLPGPAERRFLGPPPVLKTFLEKATHAQTTLTQALTRNHNGTHMTGTHPTRTREVGPTDRPPLGIGGCGPFSTPAGQAGG